MDASITDNENPLRQDIAAVRAAIAKAAERAGRDGQAVSLVLVSKTVPVEQIRRALAAGERLFGENRAQDLAAKAAELASTVELLHTVELPGAEDLTDPREPSRARVGPEWHFLGHLQTNKAKYVARVASMIQSLDSIEVARELERRLQREGRPLDALVQVNISGETAKSGVAPEEALPLIRRVASECDALRLRGLMTIGPLTDDPATIRQAFRRMRRLWDELRGEAVDRLSLDVLSMGMSGDFEIAVEEGATMVRVGTAIFGARKERPNTLSEIPSLEPNRSE